MEKMNTGKIHETRVESLLRASEVMDDSPHSPRYQFIGILSLILIITCLGLLLNSTFLEINRTSINQSILIVSSLLIFLWLIAIVFITIYFVRASQRYAKQAKYLFEAAMYSKMLDEMEDFYSLE